MKRKKYYLTQEEQDLLLKLELDKFVAGLNGGEMLAPLLLRLMKEKSLESPQIYHAAELDRQTYNKLIQLGRYNRASKQTLLQICIGIRATEEEAIALLATCGFAFEPGLNKDRAFLFCIRKGDYRMVAVYEAMAVLDAAGR